MQTRQSTPPDPRPLSDAEFEALPQPVISYGAELKAGDVLPFHRHRRAQLVYASRGVITVATRSAAFVVPPQRYLQQNG